MYVRKYVRGEIVKKKERDVNQMTDPVLSLYKIVHAYVRTYVQYLRELIIVLRELIIRCQELPLVLPQL